jgi:hypothetical protein
VKAVQAGKSFGPDRITPLRLADLLERDCLEAIGLVQKIDTTDNASLRYEVADVEAWALLGTHLAKKLRGAVALATYRLTGDEAVRQKAISHLTAALADWDQLVAVTRPIYRDMKLKHYNGNSFDANPQNLFHWALIRDEVARDVDVARR